MLGPCGIDQTQVWTTMPSGTLFIVAAPSGAGKTTLVSRLLAEDANVRHSISYTTRAPRPGEQNGREYHFIDGQRFLAMRERGEFAEWAEVHDNFYGTSRLWLEQRMKEGCDMMLEIDWQGAQQMRRQFPEAVGIFILPPSVAELENRLRRRGADSEDVIARRVAGALGEMRHVGEFDFVIINKDLDVALGELKAAVRASRLRFSRQRARHPDVFRFLDQD
jgi:guanylate kinase